MSGYRCAAARERPPASAQANWQVNAGATPPAMTESGAAAVSDPAGQRAARINIDADELKNGLAQLVLALVRLLHELLEKQAIRRIEAGQLTEEECERVGFALMMQSGELEKLRRAFGLSEDDLNLDLGPLGRLL